MYKKNIVFAICYARSIFGFSKKKSKFVLNKTLRTFTILLIKLNATSSPCWKKKILAVLQTACLMRKHFNVHFRVIAGEWAQWPLGYWILRNKSKIWKSDNALHWLVLLQLLKHFWINRRGIRTKYAWMK